MAKLTKATNRVGVWGIKCDTARIPALIHSSQSPRGNLTSVSFQFRVMRKDTAKMNFFHRVCSRSCRDYTLRRTIGFEDVYPSQSYF